MADIHPLTQQPLAQPLAEPVAQPQPVAQPVAFAAPQPPMAHQPVAIAAHVQPQPVAQLVELVELVELVAVLVCFAKRCSLRVRCCGRSKTAKVKLAVPGGGAKLLKCGGPLKSSTPGCWHPTN